MALQPREGKLQVRQSLLVRLIQGNQLDRTLPGPPLQGEFRERMTQKRMLKDDAVRLPFRRQGLDGPQRGIRGIASGCHQPSLTGRPLGADGLQEPRNCPDAANAAGICPDVNLVAFRDQRQQFTAKAFQGILAEVLNARAIGDARMKLE